MRKNTKKIWKSFGLLSLPFVLTTLSVSVSCDVKRSNNTNSNSTDNNNNSNNSNPSDNNSTNVQPKPKPIEKPSKDIVNGSENPKINNNWSINEIETINLEDHVFNKFGLAQLSKNSRKITFWFTSNQEIDIKTLSNFYLIINKNEKVTLNSLRNEKGLFIGEFTLSKLESDNINIQLKYSKEDKKYNSNIVEKDFEFEMDELGEISANLVSFSKTTTDRSQIYPSELKLEDLQISVAGGNSSLFNYSIKSIDHFIEQKDQKVSDWLGAIGIIVEFENKNNPDSKIVRKFTFSGFRNNPKNGTPDHNFNIQLEPYEPLDQDYVIYSSLSHKDRFDIENITYLRALSNHLKFKGISPTDYHKDINLNSKKAILDFDKKAKEIGVDSYESSYLKGFTLPKFNDQGEFEGLSLSEGKEVDKAPVRSDSIGRNQWRYSGLARNLVNDHYKKIAKQTYSVEFTNPKDGHSYGTFGTMWILDFEKKEDGSYPTKWYFGTNLHVADAFRDDTIKVMITKIREDANFDKEFSTVNDDQDIERFYFDQPLIKKGLVKKVFQAKDFLNSKPSDYLTATQKEKYKNLEEYADFAVLEFDFNNINSSQIWALSNNPSRVIDNEYDDIMNNPSEFAKFITYNYANDEQNHIRFKTTSYLSDYSQIDRPMLKKESDKKEYLGDNLYALGYPASFEDYFLLNENGDPIPNDDRWGNRRETNSLWTNSNPEFYWHKNEYTKEYKDLGNYLSSQLGYRTFTNKPGVLDAFISATHTGDDFYQSGNDKLIAFGLNYLSKSYVPYGGSSGSSFRNQKNELIGIFHSGNGAARTGMFAAFRSEGFDYKGLYGPDYKLPEYDLIYGGGENQKNSYREALKKLYPNMKTNLFPQSLNTYPEEFKFKK
ncbi:Ig-specific serine endopeptidase MIP [Mycoplasmopsis canis]|uniref:Ig-specific serine endopeptidase MIP n=1 Tax=Mycoplasmopsis canis TaxID=29555 RepID=UPI00025AD005|nr:DUF31 family protein [Mycoplasmopsis canis]EIE40204.1 conserved hypothetical lipoprotein [Mycoplasmopsis canis UF33]